MIRITGFKRAFLMPTNRRPRHFSETPGRRIGDHSQGFFPRHDLRTFFLTSLFFCFGSWCSSIPETALSFWYNSQSFNQYFQAAFFASLEK